MPDDDRDAGSALPPDASESDSSLTAADIPWGPPVRPNNAASSGMTLGDEPSADALNAKAAYDRVRAFGDLRRAATDGHDPRLPHERRRAALHDPAISESMTDASHAERFAECYGLEIRYDHRRERWLHYEAPRWRPDADGYVTRAAVEFARLRQMESVTIDDKKTRELALQYFIRAESKAAIDRMLALARCFFPIADKGEHWDEDPWLLCCPNGVVDLKTGALRDGDPADRITMSTEVAYDETATCPRWLQFVREIFEDDPQLITFIQRFVGYGVTGVTHEQLLAFFFGGGANGKGTFMNTIAYILGDYAHVMPFATVEMRNRGGIPNDVAALEHRRWVIASETNEGTHLNEARIKALTGSDPMTARYLHGEFFTFQPRAKFVLAVNHKPLVRDTSYGFWRRIRLVPFTRSFQSDRGVAQEFERVFRGEEGPGILRWAIEGALAWQREGLTLPLKIVQATEDYQTSSDPLNDFLEACVDFDKEAETRASDLQAMYVKWAELQRIPKGDRMSAKVLGARLQQSLQMRHTERGNVYFGIRLQTNNLF